MKCKYCGFDRPLEDFIIIRHRHGSYRRLKCKTCTNADQRALKRKRTKEHWRNEDLKRNYGITLAQYRQMVTDQGYVCAICEQDPTEVGDMLCVDHDHNTGQIRGLLCRHCNRALGIMRDNPEWCRQMAEYLEKSKKNWIQRLSETPWQDSEKTPN